MNPCPCGHLGDVGGRCHCTREQIARYRGRISGPLLDRIDMHIEVPRQAVHSHMGKNNMSGEPSAVVRRRVENARLRQLERQQRPNQALAGREIESFAQAEPSALALLRLAMDRLGLSMRSYHRILKVALTIADLEGIQGVRERHVSEAIALRCLDRQYMGQ